MYHIIINPASRSGKGLLLWKQEVEPALHREGVTYRSYFSEKSGDVARLANEILAAHPERPICFIILGGDGTVNEFIQEIEDTTGIILGYIPTGSSNDLARDLKIPKDPTAALDLILHTGVPHPMDLGCISFPDGEKRRFTVSCGIGFDAAVCAKSLTSKIKPFMNKIGLGKLTYLGIALTQLVAAKKISATLTIDNQPPIAIGNMLFTAGMIHRYEGGGFMFAPDAIADDGIINLCAVGDVAKPVILCALPTAFKGKHYMFNGVTPYKANKYTIEATAPMWVHTDGEVIRQSSSISVSITQRALQIICAPTGQES